MKNPRIVLFFSLILAQALLGVFASCAGPETSTEELLRETTAAKDVPILLFHHIGTSPTNTRYYASPDLFEEIIQNLHDLGYTPISTTTLVTAIKKGGMLPARPILITFDDGDLDNYTNAFPIMQKYGFTGVLYVVVRYLDTPNFMSTAQIKEMIAAGWEIGSHTMNHADLNQLWKQKRVGQLRDEILTSKTFLETAFGVSVPTLAYPFGRMNDEAGTLAHEAQYIAAMGATGYRWEQGDGNLFCLQRCEIQGTETWERVKRFLPWTDPL
jgi:peptidoglycan/xylan/chitin deacetylase (PgdA/CDA1 family)